MERIAVRYHTRRMPVDPPSPSGTDRLFESLLKLGLPAKEAHSFVRELQRIASENVIARFGSELAGRTEAQDAKIDSLRDDIKSVKWLLVSLIIAGAMLVAILQLLRAIVATP